MILKYKRDKIYNPKELKNVARRCTQFTIDRTLLYVPLTSKATRLLMIIPGMKLLINLIMKSGKKLIKKYESMEALPSKEEPKCQYLMK